MNAAAEAPSIPLTDPTHRPVERPSAFTRWVLGLLNDERDLPFVWTAIEMTLVQVPLAVLTFVWFQWWLAPVYWLVLFAGYLDRYILMLHNTSHRPLFKKRYGWLNRYIPWVLGPFYGETPETYFAHHLGMHHPENNLPADLSSTMRYERDNLLHWLHYFFRFFFLTNFELPAYLRRKSRSRLALRTTLGELSFLVPATLLAIFVDWRAALVVFFVPLAVVRFLMMAGNWAQHAFIDPAQPGNSYLNSITCINCRYNRRAFNDGYHIGHHVKANRHWTELPGDFQANVDRYAKEGAIVFQGIDFFGIWVLLMLRRYDSLARHYVSLDGTERSREEIVALLRSRTRPIVAAAPG